eukprot:UN22641
MAPNGELFDYLIHEKKFKPDMTVGIFSQLIAGLEHCHGKGIAHRDLKPENLLLDRRFGLKIADWGFSYIYDKGNGKTLMRTELGTRGYMAPEILGQKKYDGQKTDVFAAGVILFICLAGFPPFQNATREDWWFDKLQKKKYKLFWMAHERTASFGKDAKQLVQHMLNPDPNKRATLAEVRDSDFMKGNNGLDVKSVRERLHHIKKELKANTQTAAKDSSRAIGGLFEFCQKGNLLSMTEALKNSNQDKLSTSDDLPKMILTLCKEKIGKKVEEALTENKTQGALKKMIQGLKDTEEFAVTSQQVAQALGVKEDNWVSDFTREIVNHSDLMGDTLGFSQSDTEVNKKMSEHFRKCQKIEKEAVLRDFSETASNTNFSFEVRCTMGVIYHAIVHDYIEVLLGKVVNKDVNVKFQGGQILFDRTITKGIK